MTLLITHNRYRCIYLLLGIAFLISTIFFSLIPNGHDAPYLPAFAPGIGEFTSSPTDHNCDPFAQQVHLHFDPVDNLQSYFATFSPHCKASSPPWLTQMAELGPSEPPVEALKDKTVLLLGDSLERMLLRDLCNKLRGNFTVHPSDSYAIPTTQRRPSGGLPRSCRIAGPSGQQGLTIISYFFYGYDEEDMWQDKLATWSYPPRYSGRWTTFANSAYPSVFGVDGMLAGTPSGERGYPDLVLVNQGLWELARFDRLEERSRADDPPELLVDPITVSPEFMDQYITLTVDFLARIRALVGDDARIRWRQMHTPRAPTGEYFTDPMGTQQKSRARFTAVKVRVLNEAAAYACQLASQAEFERRSENRWAGGEDGRITVFPVGDLIDPWPANEWMRDDVHPTIEAGMAVWGGGMFEFLARTPKPKVKVK